ncbi:unnamed protein product [Calypogeia fissa]
MKLSMSSIHHWARSSVKPVIDDLGFDPSRDMSFSWSGVKIFVDLQIDSECPEKIENAENVCHALVQDPTIPLVQYPDDDDDDTLEPCSTREVKSLQYDTNAMEEDLLMNVQKEERDCNKQHSSEVEAQCGAAAEPEDTNWTHCTWPEWGEPLPPEDLDDDMEVDSAANGGEKNHSSIPKGVFFPDVLTVVEPSRVQEERETGSFSYAGSSDEELEEGADQVTSSSSDGNPSGPSPLRVSCQTEKERLNSADVSAACHLLELGNESKRGESKAGSFESSSFVPGKGNSDLYDPSRDLERLSELVEKLYATVPQLSIVSNSEESGLSEELGFWTIELLEDSGRLKMKRIKRKKQAKFEGFDVLEMEGDDDSEVLERPHWKRHYRSLSKLS